MAHALRMHPLPNICWGPCSSLELSVSVRDRGLAVALISYCDRRYSLLLLLGREIRIQLSSARAMLETDTDMPGHDTDRARATLPRCQTLPCCGNVCSVAFRPTRYLQAARLVQLHGPFRVMIGLANYMRPMSLKMSTTANAPIAA